MSRPQLDNLVRIGQLKVELPVEAETRGLLRSDHHRLDDAGREELSLESRFDLAYNAANALGLAALRFLGYRSESVNVLPEQTIAPRWDSATHATHAWR
jgi:hypothetical protein